MSDIASQAHSKFKLFVGELAADHSIGALADQVAAFAAEANIAPKSIGVEFLESAKRVVISLGYREDETPYPVKLTCVPLGKVDVLSADFTALEAAMTAASAKLSGIICHELYLTNTGDFFMVFMTTAA